MTAGEWESSDDTLEMLRSARDRASERKLRLFACACLRRVLPLLPDKAVSQKTIEFAERFAEGLATRNELHGQAWGPPGGAFPVVGWSAFDAAENAALYAAGVVRLSAAGETQPGPLSVAAGQSVEELLSEQQEWAEAAQADERIAQVHLARDIFGNPFRPVAFEPRWRTAEVVGLARAIYEDRAFDRLPLLADALMDAGCGHDELLSHCRSEGPHVRGCWVIDLVLCQE